MKKPLTITLLFTLLTTSPVFADESAELKTQLEEIQAQLEEKEKQAEMLRVEYEGKQQNSLELQAQVDKQARLIQLMKNALNIQPQTTGIEIEEFDDDDDILEIELTE